MNELLSIFIAFICYTGTCYAQTITITREAMAIASCESGDGYNYGTIDWNARSSTADGGAWQLNDYTGMWLVGRDHAELWEPVTQYQAFTRLWDNGRGYRHWSASQPCWSRWLVIQDDRAVWYNNISVE